MGDLTRGHCGSTPSWRPSATLVDALLGTCSHLIGGRRGQRLRELGLEGYVRIVDCTHGDAGHHPHLRAALFLRPLRPAEDVFDLLQPLDRLIRSAWQERLVGLDFKAPAREAVRLIPFNRSDSAGRTWRSRERSIRPGSSWPAGT